MRKFLKKRWKGLPVGLVVGFSALILIAGSVAAAYTFLNQEVNVTVNEPMLVEYSIDGGASWVTPNDGTPIAVVCYSGESMLINIRVTNSAHVSLNVTSDFVDSSWVPVTWATVTGLPNGSMAPGTWVYNVIATVPADTPAGSYTGYVVFNRG